MESGLATIRQLYIISTLKITCKAEKYCQHISHNRHVLRPIGTIRRVPIGMTL